MAADDGEKLTGTSLPLADRYVVHQAITTSIVFSCLIFFWSVLRFWARKLRYAPIHVEDVLFYISVAAFYGMIVGQFLALYLGGVGHHMSQLDTNHVARLTQTLLAIQALYALTMCTSKWSILWMLKRIFVVRKFWIFTWAIIIVQACWAIMTVLIGLLICRPIQKNWDPTVEGSCGDQVAGYTAVSIVNVIVDVVMCILPLPVIWGLQVQNPYKLALFGVFSIGIVSVIFSVLRLLSLRSIDFDDFAFSIPEVLTWTYAESGVIILVAGSPLLRPVFDFTVKKFLSSFRSKDQYAPSSQENRKYNSASSMQPKKKKPARDGFITVGDSDENLELSYLHGNVHAKSTAAAGDGSAPPSEGSRGRGTGKNGKTGIIVEKEVSQTWSDDSPAKERQNV